MGTPGGTVTWSLAAAGTDITRFGVSTGVSTTGDTFLDFDYTKVIADAFAEWSKYGDIEFQQVADQGGAAGVGMDADIRIYFGEIPGGTAGYAFYPSFWGGAIGGDILLDTLNLFNTDRALFENLVLHEIGHAIGLGHVSGEPSIMRPNIAKIGLQEDDIEGIIEIYGAQDNLPPDPGPEVSQFQGDDKDNQIAGTGEADAIDGAEGNDFLRGRAGDDTVNGGAGSDTIYGGRGNDMLRGDSSSDLLNGRVGRDELEGGDGSDLLFGGRGRDLIDGGEMHDTLKGGRGADTLTGGTGDDLLKGGKYFDTFVFADSHGHDTIVDFDAISIDEKIDFTNFSAFTSIDDVLLNTTQRDDGVMIQTGADSSILLRNVELNDLDNGDFLF